MLAIILIHLERSVSYFNFRQKKKKIKSQFILLNVQNSLLYTRAYLQLQQVEKSQLDLNVLIITPFSK
jgi:hypothetical protein